MKWHKPELLTSAEDWMAVASGEAILTLAPVGEGLRMDYDFHGGGGFVVARKSVRRTMPEAFELSFKIRGRGQRNNLEVKLVDATGKNVWRVVRKDFALPKRWQKLVVTSQDMEFAWGPAGGGAITNLGAIELALVAGEGGEGSVIVGEISLEDRSFSNRPVVKVSSAMRGHSKSRMLDGKTSTSWRASAKDPRPTIELDSLEPRVLGGLIVEWEAAAPAKGFTLRGSKDGRRWQTMFKRSRCGGSRSFIYLPRTTTRYLRLELNEPAGVVAIRTQPFEFSRSQEAFFHAVAAVHPRGWHPRWLMREQSLWTPAGGLMQNSCALLNEQGLWEPNEGTFCVEPFVRLNGKLKTWADVTITQGLMDEWMPVPWVQWQGNGWRLIVEAKGCGRQLRYRFENESGKAMKVRLHAVLRPFQVTPPWQHFRNVGGVSPISELEWKDNAVRVNGMHEVKAVTKGASFGAMAFDDGIVCEILAKGGLPHFQTLRDPFAFASGVLAYDFQIPPGGNAEVVLEYRSLQTSTPLCANDRELWQNTLPHNQLRASGWAREVVNAQLTATGHVLLTQAGPALQPGPRRYTRSWIRDGTIMSAALLRMGRAEEVRKFIEWFAPHQREDGFVPCCVDRNGVDWLVEHDSHGQLIALIWDTYRFTRDRPFLMALWPVIHRAVDYIEKLREKDGLLPVSVSHEGYLAQPVHSFWDDFWAVRGLRDAAAIAKILHRPETAQWQALAGQMNDEVFAAVEATRAAKGLQYTPASREWADFDPTATANAITLLDVPRQFNTEALHWTFNKYMEDWRRRRAGDLPWTNYTAYEIRIIGALVRLRMRVEALELLIFFLADRRPLAWNQWPEISWIDPLSPGHVGDVPHTWIAAEYVLATRSLFAYESESREALVLAAGVAIEWLDGDGVIVTDMTTYHGPLSYRLWNQGKKRLACDIKDGLKLPKGGLVLRPPGKIRKASINGKEVKVSKDEVVIRELPAHVVIQA